MFLGQTILSKLWSSVASVKRRRSYQLVTNLFEDPKLKKTWTWLHVDFDGQIDSLTYLKIVDNHSKWAEFIPLRQATTTSNLTALDKAFSDKGTQLTSCQFGEFWAQRSTEHIRTPSYHPQSKDRLNVLWTHSDEQYSKQKTKER